MRFQSQHWSGLLGMAIVSAALAACGGGGNGEQSAPTGIALGAMTSTTTAAAATSTSSGDPTATPMTLPTTIPAPLPTPTLSPVVNAALDAIALTLHDLPEGYTQLPAEPSSSDSGPCGNPDFARKENRLGEIEVQFQRSEFGPFVLQNVVDFPEADADDAFEYARSAINCTEWTETDANGAPTTFRVSSLELAAVGDESFAVRVELDIEGVGTLITDTVFIRVGTILAIIGYATVDAPDLEALATLAATAAGKMATAELP